MAVLSRQKGWVECAQIRRQSYPDWLTFVPSRFATKGDGRGDAARALFQNSGQCSTQLLSFCFTPFRDQYVPSPLRNRIASSPALLLLAVGKRNLLSLLVPPGDSFENETLEEVSTTSKGPDSEDPDEQSLEKERIDSEKQQGELRWVGAIYSAADRVHQSWTAA